MPPDEMITEDELPPDLWDSVEEFGVADEDKLYTYSLFHGTWMDIIYLPVWRPS